jgi:hypothetical protein
MYRTVLALCFTIVYKFTNASKRPAPYRGCAHDCIMSEYLLTGFRFSWRSKMAENLGGVYQLVSTAFLRAFKGRICQEKKGLETDI